MSEVASTGVIAVGDFVMIDPVAPATEVRRGICRFLGETAFAEGPWVGVELVGTIGKNSGTVLEKEYFKCLPLQGVFVRPELVHPYAGTAQSKMEGSDPAAEVAEQRPQTATELELRIALEEAAEKNAELSERHSHYASQVECLQLDLEIAKEQLLLYETELEELKASGPAAGGVRTDSAEALVAVKRKNGELEKELARLRDENAELHERLNAADSSDAMIEELSDRKLALEEELNRVKVVLESIVKERDDLREVVALQDEELGLQREQCTELTGTLDLMHGRTAAERQAAVDETFKLQRKIDALEQHLIEAEQHVKATSASPASAESRPSLLAVIPSAVMQALHEVQLSSDARVEQVLARPSIVAARMNMLLDENVDNKTKSRDRAVIAWHNIALVATHEAVSWITAAAQDLCVTLTQVAEELFVQAAGQDDLAEATFEGDSGILPSPVATALLSLDVAFAVDIARSRLEQCRSGLSLDSGSLRIGDSRETCEALDGVSRAATAMYRVLRDVHRAVVLSSSKNVKLIDEHLRQIQNHSAAVDRHCRPFASGSVASGNGEALPMLDGVKNGFGALCAGLRRCKPLHHMLTDQRDVIEEEVARLGQLHQSVASENTVLFVCRSLQFITTVALLFFQNRRSGTVELCPLLHSLYSSCFGATKADDAAPQSLLLAAMSESLQAVTISSIQSCIDFSHHHVSPLLLPRRVAKSADDAPHASLTDCLMELLNDTMTADSNRGAGPVSGEEVPNVAGLVSTLQQEISATKAALSSIEAVKDALQVELEHCKWNLWQAHSENEALSLVKADLGKMQERMEAQDVAHERHLKAVTSEYEGAIQLLQQKLKQLTAELKEVKRQGLQRELSPLSLRERCELEDTIHRLRLQLTEMSGNHVSAPLSRIIRHWSCRAKSLNEGGTSALPVLPTSAPALPVICDFTTKASRMKAREVVFYPQTCN